MRLLQRHDHALGQMRSLDKARNRLMASDGQRLAAAVQPMVAAERPVAAGRDDDVQAVATMTALIARPPGCSSRSLASINP
jgi:hypothetical protein